MIPFEKLIPFLFSLFFLLSTPVSAVYEDIAHVKVHESKYGKGKIINVQAADDQVRYSPGFPDHDCRYVKSKYGVEWNRWREFYETTPSKYWFQNYPSDIVTKIDQMQDDWAKLVEECPFGMLVFYSNYLLECTAHPMRELKYGIEVYGGGATTKEAKANPDRNPNEAISPFLWEDYNKDISHLTEAQIEYAKKYEQGCYDFVAPDIEQLLVMYPLSVLLGSQWPVLSILSARNLGRTMIGREVWQDEDINCLNEENRNRVLERIEENKCNGREGCYNEDNLEKPPDTWPHIAPDFGLMQRL